MLTLADRLGLRPREEFVLLLTADLVLVELWRLILLRRLATAEAYNI